MPPETEAACLLRSGLAFPSRVGLVETDGNLVFAGFKPGGFALYLGDEPYFHFDLEGRWQRALVSGTHFLKELNGSVEAIDRRRVADALTLHRRRLSLAETLDLDASIRSVALRLIQALQDGSIHLESPPEPGREVSHSDLLSMLDRIADWDDAAWFRQRERYLATYAPSGFLPPSCPSPIVLQASVLEDASRGFSPVPAVLRTPGEFADHVRSVAALLGRRAVQARGLVIQHGDFWNQPAEVIRPYLERASEVFPLSSKTTRPRLSERSMDEPMLDGFYAFLPNLSGLGPDRVGWAMLTQLGLRRVDLGADSVFSVDRETLKSRVRDLQDAGIGVGLVLLLGAEPGRSTDEEAQATVSLVNDLGLRPNDHVYLMEAPEVLEAPSADQPEPEPRIPSVRARLLQTRPKGGYRVVPYSLSKQ
ncbi:MAG TPA: hypothetical protein VFT74_04430 [Isosphaeraceae bacterium]|nr:hypothetical protein [Isosphaeraceae bacterium]